MTKEEKQQFCAGCLLGLGILGLLICATVRGYHEVTRHSEKSNDKIIQTIKSSLNQSR